MSFYSLYSEYKDLKDYSGLSDSNAARFADLLFRQQDDLEVLAREAQRLALRNFGRTIQLYTPLYLSNYCDNQCIYCGFNRKNSLSRRRLGFDELKKEAEFIAATGLKHVLILTGESRRDSPVSYIKDCVKILKDYFSSISIEVYPLSQNEYSDLVACGVDGLTIYQEVYDEQVYARVHVDGPKKDYLFRLDAPERGAQAGIRSVNIGVLLGLNDWRREVFFLGLHAKYLQDKFPEAEIGVSLPRLRPFNQGFKVPYPVSDREFVRIILALRIFLPRAGISISTREDKAFRDNLIPLGITRMSAGSTTRVGGHTVFDRAAENMPQFEISDERSVQEIKNTLQEKGYQPVLKDWMHI